MRGFVPQLLLLLLLGATSAVVVAAEDGVRVTGHRLVRTERDFSLYVIGEPLPTVMLVHSSNEEECNPRSVDCAELFATFKQAAEETKGYVRFASLDVADKDVMNIIKSAMPTEEKPPLLFAFSDRGEGSAGRQAMRLNTMGSVPLAGLKKIASDLLPNNVHRCKSLEDLGKLTDEAKSKSRPLVVLLAPKLSDKPTPMLKATWALLKGSSNFTTVDYSTPAGQDVLKSLPEFAAEAAARNETFVLGLDSVEGRFVKSAEPSVTPDSVLAFAKSLGVQKSSGGEKTTTKKKKKAPIPRGVYSNFTDEDLDRLVMRPNTATVLALRRARTSVDDEEEEEEAVHPPADLKTNLTFMAMASTLLSEFGVHSAIVYCDHPTAPPRLCRTAFEESGPSDSWALFVVPHKKLAADAGSREYQRFDSLVDAMGVAGTSMLEAERASEDALEVLEGPAATDFLQLTMAQFSSESMRPTARMPLMYLGAEGEEEPPAFLVAAHASMRGLSKVVFVKCGSGGEREELLRKLHLDPATTLLPTLVAYVPDLATLQKSIEEMEAEASRGRKKKKGAEPPKQPQLSFRVVPFDSQKQAFGGKLMYETAVMFMQDLFRFVDEKRWERFIEDVFSITVPPALANPLLDRLGKSRLSSDSAKIPPVEFVRDSAAFERACGTASLCVVAFSDVKDDVKRLETVEAARKAIDQTPVGAGVRFALVDGSCHSRVVEALGGDPSMLPLVSAMGKKGFAVMRGAFTSDNIQALVRAVKKGAQGFTPFPTSSSSSIGQMFASEESECYAQQNGGGDNEEDDDMLQELREEAEREQKQKEQARKQAEDDARRLKTEREAELKKQREEMHKKAEEERLKKKKAQMELDEQRLKLKKEQAEQQKGKKSEEL